MMTMFMVMSTSMTIHAVAGMARAMHTPTPPRTP